MFNIKDFLHLKKTLSSPDIKYLINMAKKYKVSSKNKHKIDEIINKIKNAGMEIHDISTDEGNLEDVFIDLTKS